MKKCIVVMVALLSGVFAASGQHRSVIAGLEENPEYVRLVAEEGVLVVRTDSLSQAIEGLRTALRMDMSDRETTSAAILRLEEETFGVRSRMARIAGRINAIEQEWVLQNLYAEFPDGRGVEDTVTEQKEHHSANLVFSSWFERRLPPEQLRELRQAQMSETEIPAMVARYLDNHTRAQALAGDYDLATTQNSADSIKAGFELIAMENRSLDGLVGRGWEKIFDEKSYIYNLLADKENRADMLARYDSGLEELREERSRLQGKCASEALVNYLLQKRMLTDYEIYLAGESGNSAAADSLRQVAAALPHPDMLLQVGPVELKERLFFDYNEVRFEGSPYSADNPIPEVSFYPRGIIYRVWVGASSSHRPVSDFRGAWPLSVQKGEDGRFHYFAGGFPSDSLASEAAGQLRRAGFREPVVVVWMDGIYIDPRAVTDEKIYRIELTGAEELSPEMRQIIDAETGSGTIVRSGKWFVVAPLGAASATRLRTTLANSDPEMEIVLSKISE